MAVRVRYIVDDVDAAVAFYCHQLGLPSSSIPAPASRCFARGDLRLLLNTPDGGGGAAQAMPDGRRPEPGDWNQIQLEVDDLAAEVERLGKAGVAFPNEVVVGRGGKQILLEDPAGNPVELFEALAS